MSAGLVCDNCGETLVLNSRGDDENGERAGWIEIVAGTQRADLCTIACAHQWLDSPEVQEMVAAHQELIASISRTIREADEEEAEGDE